jgi:tetraacyldisaccharide 4'-kinase
MLREQGVELLKTHPFPDHHPYQPAEIDRLLAEARQFDACCVTTEKDHVRLPLTLRNSVKKIPIKLRFHQPDALIRLLPDHAGSPTSDLI